MPPTDPPPEAVLARYGAAVAGLFWTRAFGGFSGAAVWRGDDHGTPLLAVKAWPAGFSADRLVAIHDLMRRAGHLPFVPAVIPSSDGTTVVTEVGRAWDVTRWMPGKPDYHANPSPNRLTNAVTALARLHHAWKPPAPRFAPCPAVIRRLRALADWSANSPTLPPLDDPLRHAAALLAQLTPAAERALTPWAEVPVPVQPCLCDVWHDHVLFTGDVVTGLIDYGAAKNDHVAADLARLLGDLVGDDDLQFAAGLIAYRAVSTLPDVNATLVRLLDRTGVLCGAAGWVLRFAGGPRPLPAAVADRLDKIVNRIESAPHF
jgi:homoserine kinase type II